MCKWIYAVEARLLAPGPERTRALAMTFYLDPRAKVVASPSAEEKSELNSVAQEEQSLHSPAING
jgi:hypothetical protein